MPPRPPRPPVVDTEPVAAGRFVLAAVAIVAMGFLPFNRCSQQWFPTDAPPEAIVGVQQPGSTVVIGVSVVTSDYAALSCASDRSYDGLHCSFKDKTTPWPVDPSAPIDENKRNVLQPYRTWDTNHLVLLAGLWAEPTVALRLHREPPSAQAKTLARFVARCKVKIVETTDKSTVRWSDRGAWTDCSGVCSDKPVLGNPQLLVGRVESCSLEGDG